MIIPSTKAVAQALKDLNNTFFPMGYPQNTQVCCVNLIISTNGWWVESGDYKAKDGETVIQRMDFPATLSKRFPQTWFAKRLLESIRKKEQQARAYIYPEVFERPQEYWDDLQAAEEYEQGQTY